MTKIKVALVDDHALFREGIRLILSSMPGIELVAEADRGSKMLDLIPTTIPDVLLLDLDMPDMSGMELFEQIRKQKFDVKILVLTMHKEDRMISYLMEIGANGYLLKDCGSQQLEEAIKTVQEKGVYYTDRVSDAMRSGLMKKVKHPPKIGQEVILSKREQQVLELIAEGLSNKEIGDRLFISARTVDGHRTNLLAKFGVNNTAKLLMKAVREGFLKD